MDKRLVFKILISLMCIKIDATEFTRQYQIKFMCVTEKWQKMCFEEILSPSGWMKKGDLCKENSGHGLVLKLKLIPLLMGCGYGQDLTDYFWLMTYTVNVCKNLPPNNALDCWRKLQDTINTGVLTISLLLDALTHIHSLDLRLTNPFYNILNEIRDFLKDHGSDVSKSFQQPESTGFNVHLGKQVIFLTEILNAYCLPENKEFKLQALMTEFGYGHPADAPYDFFLNRLNDHTTFIQLHLFTRLGFRYEDGVVVFAGEYK